VEHPGISVIRQAYVREQLACCPGSKFPYAGLRIKDGRESFSLFSAVF